MTRVEKIKKALKNKNVIFSHICSPQIHLSDGYIRILRPNSVDIISHGSVFYLTYDELSDKVLDKILETLNK